jgi:hypothetical protein
VSRKGIPPPEEFKIERNPETAISIWLLAKSRNRRRMAEEDEAAAPGGQERSSSA